jgi:succinate dehydrogenase/fumarate reductase flavoprotein subunit
MHRDRKCKQLLGLQLVIRLHGSKSKQEEDAMGSYEGQRKVSKVTRRAFLQAVAGAGGTVALAGSAGRASAEPVPRKWDRVADVVCIGYGGAGAATAIVAHDAGAKVLILEKMTRGGGNTVVSGGGVLCPTNAQDAFTYIKALYEFSHSDMDSALVRVFADESVKNIDYLKSLRNGTEARVYGYAGYPTVPGAKSQVKHRVRGKATGPTGDAENLWDLLTYAVEEKRKIPVMLETPARQLVTNSRGEVTGVIAELKGREIAIRANRAVVLTTGGYEYDTRTLQNSVKGYPIYALGNPGNTGDGVRMAQKVGAGLWHMNGVSCPLGAKVPGIEAAFIMQIISPRHIFVDKHGGRFVNEKSIELHAGLLAVDYFDTHTLDYPRIPCYAVFDERARKEGPITAFAGGGYAGLNYKWSKDNTAEIERGWILGGDTLVDLAGKIKGMNPATLENTVAKWNDDLKRGEDTQFHRPIRAPKREGGPAYKELETPLWSAVIDVPPFYAIPLYPALLNTQGGPRRNTKAQVLDAFGDPIPRLYSAGELGSMWGLIYQGAGNIAECIVFGRIAGKNAADEKPWE